MPRACSVCAHAERDAIEAAIVARTSYRVVSRQFRVSHDAIQRHATNHLAQAIQDVRREQVMQSGSLALDRMTQGERIVDEILAFAWGSEIKAPELALKALGELRRQVELRAKLEGELDERSITVTAIPEWRELRALLVEALTQYPQAKMAVLRAMEAYDHERSA